MLKVGISGFGYMGRMHMTKWNRIPGAKTTAIWDFDPVRLTAEEKIDGNIEGIDDNLDLAGIKLYSDYDKMLAEEKLDIVSITLPTFLHLEYTVKALQAGLNVFCEKPMALDLAQCDEMIAIAKNTEKQLMIAHCIRFWPEYVAAKQIVDSKKYGEILVANFRRRCQAPIWSWDNWMTDPKRSGGSIMDLHIHDVDFIQYLFGMPESLCSHGIVGPYKGYDHLSTSFDYGNDRLVIAEGGWLYKEGFGFEMSFDIICERASIVFNNNADPAIKVYPENSEAFVPDLLPEDGYFNEIADFADCLKNNKTSKVITLEDSRNTIQLIEAEKKSIDTGEKLFLNRL